MVLRKAGRNVRLTHHWVGLLVALMVVGSWCVISSETGVASPPEDPVAVTLRDLAATVTEMQRLYELRKLGQVDMNGVILTFSDENKAALLDRYMELKGRLGDLYEQLP